MTNENIEYDIVVSSTPHKGFCRVVAKHFNIWENVSKKFKFRVKNYFFSPKYKNGTWDGYIQMLKYDGKLPIGLLDYLVEKIAPLYNYSISVDDVIKRIDYDKEKISRWVDTLNIPFEVRDYQYNAFYEGICKKINGIVSITGSGKSLIIYLFVRFMLQIKKQTLIVVPTIQLVDQMYSDFEKYGFVDVEENCQKIKKGMDKIFSKKIIISTWQSIYKLDKTHFENIECVIVDECHGAKSSSITGILDKTHNASYRIGLSGTIPINEDADYYTLIGSFGKLKEYLSYTEAFDKGYISPMTMISVLLDYPHEDKKKIYENRKDYEFETEYVYNHRLRNLFLCKLINTLNKNTLVLFNKIEKHGKILSEYLKEYTKKTVYYIDGNTKDTIREDIRHRMEEENDIILLASYGTLSTGINIKNIHNVIFASAFRSEVKTFQSIGRGLRSLEDKELQVFDIVDQLGSNCFQYPYQNYLVDQFVERLAKYKERDFNIIKKRVEL